MLEKKEKTRQNRVWKKKAEQWKEINQTVWVCQANIGHQVLRQALHGLPCKACNLRHWQTSHTDTGDFHFVTPRLVNHPSLTLIPTSCPCNLVSTVTYPLIFMHTYWYFILLIVPTCELRLFSHFPRFWPRQSAAPAAAAPPDEWWMWHSWFG